MNDNNTSIRVAQHESDSTSSENLGAKNHALTFLFLVSYSEHSIFHSHACPLSIVFDHNLSFSRNQKFLDPRAGSRDNRRWIFELANSRKLLLVGDPADWLVD